MQDFLAILMAVIAAAFLAYRGWRTLSNRRAGACGACPSCPTNSSKNSPKLVNISPIITRGEPGGQKDFAS